MQSKVIVCGSRSISDKQYIFEALDKLLKDYDDVEIISGHARGVDTIAEAYAKERAIPLVVFSADWEQYGRAAGPIRNKEMLQFAMSAEPLVISFWDGKSRGTKNMMLLALKAGIAVLDYQGYKGFRYKLRYDDASRTFVADVVGIQDSVSASARTLPGLWQQIRDNTDLYLDMP